MKTNFHQPQFSYKLPVTKYHTLSGVFDVTAHPKSTVLCQCFVK